MNSQQYARPPPNYSSLLTSHNHHMITCMIPNTPSSHHHLLHPHHTASIHTHTDTPLSHNNTTTTTTTLTKLLTRTCAHSHILISRPNNTQSPPTPHTNQPTHFPPEYFPSPLRSQSVPRINEPPNVKRRRSSVHKGHIQ